MNTAVLTAPPASQAPARKRRRVLPGFEPGKVLKAIEQHKITSIMLVPTMLYVLMDHPDFDVS